MGREKNSIQKLKEMKLIGTLAAVAAAQWNGQSDDSTCGMQLSGASMVNSTCTVSGSSIKSMYAGNGAFITGDNTMTGFEGMSGDADVVVFFDQDCSTGECDNSTCWDATLDCVYNGVATDGVFFMETVNAANSGMVNLQIAGVSAGDAVSSDEANGSFSVTAGENFGDLLQVSVNADAVIDLFSSTVSA